MLEKLKRKYNYYLQKLAQANKDAFGEERLDCCNIQESNDNKK